MYNTLKCKVFSFYLPCPIAEAASRKMLGKAMVDQTKLKGNVMKLSLQHK